MVKGKKVKSNNDGKWMRRWEMKRRLRENC